ncbi:MAG: hypothetical protein ACYCVH_11065 [Ignavibacteriaceae bacterium]
MSNDIVTDSYGVYKSILLSALKDMFDQFIRNPYYYFYEEDLRVYLAQQLFQQIKPIEVKHLGKPIITIPIKCEYPSNSANGKRHDIVFIKRDDSKNIYTFDIPIAIELKLGSKSYDRCSEFKEDIKKLLEYKSIDPNNLGIAIYFYQDEIDNKLFIEWFRDIVEEFDKVEIDNITFDSPSVNSFIVTQSSVLSAVSYKY